MRLQQISSRLLGLLENGVLFKQTLFANLGAIQATRDTFATFLPSYKVSAFKTSLLLAFMK